MGSRFGHRTEPELGRLGEAPVAVGDAPELSGQPKLPEARQRLAAVCLLADAWRGVFVVTSRAPPLLIRSVIAERGAPGEVLNWKK